MEFEVGSSVLARVDGKEGWYAGFVTGVSEKKEQYKVVFIDGLRSEGVEKAKLRKWNRPQETDWHRRHKMIMNRYTKRRPEFHALNRGVEQIDPVTRQVLSRWPTARRAQEAFPWIQDAIDIILCCRGHFKQAGGFAWRFVESRTKIDTNDVAELISINAGIIIQKNNPKRKPSKSHQLYEQYKYANTVREMIRLGGRKADVAYDIAHGWITFYDQELNRRFSSTYSAKNPPPTLPPSADTAAASDDLSQGSS